MDWTKGTCFMLVFLLCLGDTYLQGCIKAVSRPTESNVGRTLQSMGFISQPGFHGAAHSSLKFNCGEYIGKLEQIIIVAAVLFIKDVIINVNGSDMSQKVKHGCKRTELTFQTLFIVHDRSVSQCHGLPPHLYLTEPSVMLLLRVVFPL